MEAPLGDEVGGDGEHLPGPALDGRVRLPLGAVQQPREDAALLLGGDVEGPCVKPKLMYVINVINLMINLII